MRKLALIASALALSAAMASAEDIKVGVSVGEHAEIMEQVAKVAKAPSKTAGRKLGKVAPKYRNPANPKETWTGRGKQPRWMAELTAKGNKKPEDFLIKKA